MINLIKLWSQNFFCVKQKSLIKFPQICFSYLAIQLELWSSQGLLQILNTNFLKISSLWIYMPLMKKIWFTYAELAMPSYYVLWYLRCQIFSGALLPCTAYQASWLLDYTAAPGHSQTDWKGNNIFYCLLHNV